MLGFLVQRTRTSLRVRLLLATVALLAVALAIAAVSFERAARSVIVAAVHSHLSARAKEVHDAVARFQRERDLSVRNWGEAEAMQMTLDSGDGKFAEDYLRRIIQDQNGTVAAAALLGIDGEVMAAVRAAGADQRRGTGIPEIRGLVVSLPVIKVLTQPAPGAAKTEAGETTFRDGAADIGPLSALLPGSEGDVLFLAAPIKDFAGDLVGFVVAAVERRAFSTLLAEVNGGETAFRPVLADRGGTLPVSLPGVTEPELRPVLDVPAGAPGELEHIDPPGGTPLLAVRVAGAVDTVPGWSTVMTVPQSTAFGQLYWLRGILATLFGVVLVAAGVASVAAIRQAGRPLTDVASSMAKVAGGDLSIRVQTEYSDELGHLVKSFNVMVQEVEKSRDELQRTEALRKEVQIAHQIQTAILPVSPAVKGFEVAARMKPAEDVGGDLYDILAFDDDTFWVLVGDVSGHGINSGLVMMMAQAAAYGAIADNPHCSPKDVITAVNRVVHENVRKRMKRDDYLTLMAARYMGDGRFLAAGAHQPVFIARGGGFIEVVESVGPWVGLTANPPGVEEYEFTVGPGESVCLVTDGILEATDKDGELFDQERLSAVLGAVGSASASEVLRVLFSAVEVFQTNQADDMTAVVLRRKE
jgi:phosphoserine phosphatase RsbU/P